MKNKIKIFILCITLVLLVNSCAKSSTPELENSQSLDNLEVTAEPFEQMEVAASSSYIISHKTENDLFNVSDIVVIGMPTDTFTDGTERYYNMDAVEVTKDTDEKIMYYYTTRDIKVLQVLKGDVGDTVTVAEKAVVLQDADGNEIIAGLPDTSYIAKRNVKYIYYLKKAALENMNFYFTVAYRGLVNIDGLDLRVNSNLRDERMNEVKTRYTAEFEKYDRSDELVAK